MADFPIINDTPYSNTFTKLCIAGGALWAASIVWKKTKNPSPAQQHSHNKRYMIKQKTKLNRDITHLNRNHIKPPEFPNYFARHRRYNHAR